MFRTTDKLYSESEELYGKRSRNKQKVTFFFSEYNSLDVLY